MHLFVTLLENGVIARIGLLPKLGNFSDADFSSHVSTSNGFRDQLRNDSIKTLFLREWFFFSSVFLSSFLVFLQKKITLFFL
jgi:hypothetical protein